jgi:hypothetical protein
MTTEKQKIAMNLFLKSYSRSMQQLQALVLGIVDASILPSALAQFHRSICDVLACAFQTPPQKKKNTN